MAKPGRFEAPASGATRRVGRAVVRRGLGAAAGAFLALALAACGSRIDQAMEAAFDGEREGDTATTSGLVVARAPVAGATVEARCSRGDGVTSVIATTDGAGRYRLTRPGRSVCLLRADGGTQDGRPVLERFYNVNPIRGRRTIHLNPMTSLEVALSTRTPPETVHATCCAPGGPLARAFEESIVIAGEATWDLVDLHARATGTLEPDTAAWSLAALGQDEAATAATLQPMSAAILDALAKSGRRYGDALDELAREGNLFDPNQPQTTPGPYGANEAGVLEDFRVALEVTPTGAGATQCLSSRRFHLNVCRQRVNAVVCAFAPAPAGEPAVIVCGLRPDGASGLASQVAEPLDPGEAVRGNRLPAVAAACFAPAMPRILSMTGTADQPSATFACER